MRPRWLVNGSLRSALLSAPVALLALSCASRPVEVKTAAGPGPAGDGACPAAGDARVTGRSFSRQRNGGIVSGASRPVYLDPATPYSTAVFQAITDRFFKAEKESATVVPDPAMLKCRRTVRTDADGAFAFDDVGTGSYFVSSYVSWLTPTGEWLGTWNVSSLVVSGDGKKYDVLLSGVPASIPDLPAR
jgi:hypothetical protein